LIHGGAEGAARSSGGRQILITGAGTLGRAFHRLCDVRGLPAHLAGRAELDITNSLRVDAVIRALQPWAIINSAGYVRVDDAERDPVACRRANVIGAVTLAAACHRHGIPFVTFSSDLVFDGNLSRPYLEDDDTNPLNVYGESKAAAERKVLAVSSDALIIRTSAFFGPWDEANFAAAVVRALRRGEAFAAADDTIVSPTYVPDLVMAALDLLIDGERGIYHLANDGAVTWFEFAQRIATAFDLPTQNVRAARSADICGPARRPVNSALASGRARIMRPLEAALNDLALEAAAAQWLQGLHTCASS
jgi:dTDP-4-dehydrorhamnose reductase